MSDHRASPSNEQSVKDEQGGGCQASTHPQGGTDGPSANTGGDGGQSLHPNWEGGLCAMCCVCGVRFRCVHGPLQLAEHASLHIVSQRLQWRRTHQVNPTLSVLRTASSLVDLRAALDDA